MSRLCRRWRSLICLLALLTIVAPSTGCIGFFVNVLHAVKGGHKVEAAFPGLVGKRVAVVCVANAHSYSGNTMAEMVQHGVATILSERTAKIEVIHHDEIANWIDHNDWDQFDYREIGRGVEADMVLAIDLDGVSLHEGRTLYKGRADISVKVYDMSKEGKVVFRRTIEEFTFPRNGARHTTEMSEARFRRLFVTVLTEQVAKYFYDYQFEDDFARDTTLLGG